LVFFRLCATLSVGGVLEHGAPVRVLSQAMGCSGFSFCFLKPPLTSPSQARYGLGSQKAFSFGLSPIGAWTIFVWDCWVQFAPGSVYFFSIFKGTSGATILLWHPLSFGLFSLDGAFVSFQLFLPPDSPALGNPLFPSRLDVKFLPVIP